MKIAYKNKNKYASRLILLAFAAKCRTIGDMQAWYKNQPKSHLTGGNNG